MEATRRTPSRSALLRVRAAAMNQSRSPGSSTVSPEAPRGRVDASSTGTGVGRKIRASTSRTAVFFASIRGWRPSHSTAPTTVSGVRGLKNSARIMRAPGYRSALRSLLELRQGAPAAQPRARGGRASAPYARMLLDGHETLVRVPADPGDPALPLELDEMGEHRSPRGRVHGLGNLVPVDAGDHLGRDPLP